MGTELETGVDLSANGGGDSGPSWSPDGSKIAFTRGNNIYLMDADGFNQIALTSGSGRNWQPDWKP